MHSQCSRAAWELRRPQISLSGLWKQLVATERHLWLIWVTSREKLKLSYGCSYFSSDLFGDAVISVVERFQESAKQEEAAFHKLLPRRTHIYGSAEREQPQTSKLFVLPHLNNGDTGIALNRSLRSVKWFWGPLLLLLWKLRGRSPDARWLRPIRPSPPRNGAVNTYF